MLYNAKATFIYRSHRHGILVSRGIDCPGETRQLFRSFHHSLLSKLSFYSPSAKTTTLASQTAEAITFSANATTMTISWTVSWFLGLEVMDPTLDLL